MTHRGAKTATETIVTKCAGSVAKDTERTKKMIDKYNEVGIEIEQDGFITRPETLERINAAKAKPARECAYPCCEECDKYHGHYCTVPMVVSKQVYLNTEAWIIKLEKKVNELDALIADEMLRSKEIRKMKLHDPENLTWDDYLGEEK